MNHKIIAGKVLRKQAADRTWFEIHHPAEVMGTFTQRARISWSHAEVTRQAEQRLAVIESIKQEAADE